MTFPEEISFCPEGGPEGGFLKHRKIRFHPASIRHTIYAYSTIIAIAIASTSYSNMYMYMLTQRGV